MRHLRTEHYSNGDPIPSKIPRQAQTFFELEYLSGGVSMLWSKHAASDDDFISMDEFIGLSSEDVFSEEM